MSEQSHFKKLIKRVILWSVIVGGIIALFVPVVAQSVPVFAEQSPCELFGNCVSGTPTDVAEGEATDGIFNIILNVISFLIYLVGAITVLFIIFAAYQMIFSNGDTNKYQNGVNTLKNAIIGLIIAIISVGIVQFIGSLVVNNGII